MVVLLSSCAMFGADAKGPIPASSGATKPKNIILFIGDGMSLPQVIATQYLTQGQPQGESPEPARFSFEKYPIFGYAMTYSANSLITDSAAAGTALSCGKKTNNGYICTTPDGKPVKIITQIAREKGKKIGVLSSVGANHATPAAFYAHAGERSDYNEILEEGFANGLVDVLMGGGVYGDRWTPEAISKRAAEAGYAVFDCASFNRLTPEAAAGKKVFGYFDANNNKQFDYFATRKPDNAEPRLAEMTLKALAILNQHPAGFFMMVEGGSIDWACHGNKPEEMVGEVLELDRAISMTEDFLAKNGALDDTLIIVTGDHETGGLTVTGPYKKPLGEGVKPELAWSTKNHSAFPTMVWARGPGAAPLAGKHDNTYIFDCMAAALER